MQHQWNWISLFELDTRPAFVLTPDTLAELERLAALPFEQSVRVIVSSVPHFEKHNWRDFQQAVAEYQSSDILADILLGVAETMRSLLGEVRRILRCELDRAVTLVEELFHRQDTIGQCAVAGCLYHSAYQNMKAEVILRHLLRRYDHHAEQIKQMLAFYNGLRPRLREVATLAALGYSNREIADDLVIGKAAVAEYMTTIFRTFAAQLLIVADARAMRYRLIHYMTRLFAEHPELLLSAEY